MELLFWKTTRDATEVVEGYNAETDNKKVSRNLWTETQEDELRTLFMEHQTNKYPQGTLPLSTLPLSLWFTGLLLTRNFSSIFFNLSDPVGRILNLHPRCVWMKFFLLNLGKFLFSESGQKNIQDAALSIAVKYIQRKIWKVSFRTICVKSNII